jgi:catechol 2,3-dioxygenase-like lactoylglutathione lyase family enzyme
MVSAIESVTVGVQDLDAATARYRDDLRLMVLRDSCASVGLLAAWRRPVHESVRLVELGAPEYAFGRVRLAQFECDVDSDVSKGAPVLGPQALAAPVATLAILTRNFEASERFYVEGFGWRAVGAPPNGLQRFFGTGVAPLAAFSAPENPHIDILLGQFEDRNVQCPANGSLPGRIGINLCTCRCEDLDAVEQRLAALGIEPVTRPAHVGLPTGQPGRVMLVRGPADELFELIELAY